MSEKLVVNEKQGSPELRKAWFVYKAQHEGENVSLRDFYAGWNYALAVLNSAEDKKNEKTS